MDKHDDTLGRHHARLTYGLSQMFLVHYYYYCSVNERVNVVRLLIFQKKKKYCTVCVRARHVCAFYRKEVTRDLIYIFRLRFHPSRATHPHTCRHIV